MKSKLSFFGFFLAVLMVSACAGKSPYLPFKQIPASNFQEIQVAKSYDFVFLGTFDAISLLPNWRPSKTLKDAGLIVARNIRYSRLDDSDMRVISIRIRRDNAEHTSVFLEPDSRRIIGADEVLAAIRKKFS